MSPIFCMTGVRFAPPFDARSRMSCRMSRLRSDNWLKRPQVVWSDGMGFLAIQPPQEYL